MDEERKVISGGISVGDGDDIGTIKDKVRAKFPDIEEDSLNRIANGVWDQVLEMKEGQRQEVKHEVKRRGILAQWGFGLPTLGAKSLLNAMVNVEVWKGQITLGVHPLGWGLRLGLAARGDWGNLLLVVGCVTLVIDWNENGEDNPWRG